MRRIARGILVLVLAVALLAQVAYAADSVSVVKLNQVQQRFADLTMYVNMADAGGYPCTGSYTADQFSISVDGKALDVDSVQAFDPQTQGIHYVFAVDVSKSMTAGMMQSVRDAMCAFVDSLGLNDAVTIFTFGTDVLLRIERSGDHEAIKSVIYGIDRSDNDTALYKGVIDSVELAAAWGDRSAIIVVTDGKNDPTEALKLYTKDSIYSSVKSAQMPLYCIGLNDNNGVDTESLIELAAVTGGDQFVIRADESVGVMQRVRDTVQSAVVLHATLVNTENKAGFDEVSTFKVGFQGMDGGFVVSNELQQNINWKSVPVPQAEPTPTPVPQISLELDETEVKYISGEAVTITGAIGVDQGVVAPEDLSISVNGESWRATLMRNGDGYTFSTTGSIPGDIQTLEVQAEIKALGIASRMQRLQVIAPTASPTATPAPVLSVELDDNGQSIMFVPGTVVNISGVINVQGEINPDELIMYVNGVICEMDVMQINRSQYEFSAQITITADSPAELSVQVQLGNTEIFSRAQKLFMVMPTATPAPELYLSLSDAAIEYNEGESITVRGNIEVVSGEVAPEDLALYVRGVRWDMNLEPLSDSTYGFTAENSLMDSDITQMDVKVRLLSNSQVVSNSERLSVTTPVPTVTPSPTPRPEVTPPPTATPTPVPPTPAPTDTPAPENRLQFITDITDKGRQVVNDLSASGKLWYVVGGLALVVVLVVVLIVVLVLSARKRKNKNNIEPVMSISTGFSMVNREGDSSQGKTRREDDPGATQRSGRSGSMEDSEFVDDVPGMHKSSGTIRVTSEVGGTVRLDEDRQPESGGTQRIDVVRSIEVTLEERRGGRECGSRKVEIECDQELVFGRNEDVDVVIDDSTVSGRHMTMTYDGEAVYIVDIGSTNGTKLNKKPIAPREPSRVNDGDEIGIGKTVLKIHLGETNGI